MVNAAEADIVCPAVAAEDPDGLLGEVFLVLENVESCRAVAIELFELCDNSLGSCAVLLAVVLCSDEFCNSSLYAFRSLFVCSDFFEVSDKSLTDSLLTEVHTKAVLSVILKQGVSPCRTVTLSVCGIR